MGYICGWTYAVVVSSDCCYSSAGVGKRCRGEVLVEPSPLRKSVLVMNEDCSQSTLRAHTSSSRAHASSSFPTVFDPASPALFFTRNRVLTSKEFIIDLHFGFPINNIISLISLRSVSPFFKTGVRTQVLSFGVWTVNGLKNQLWHEVLPFRFDLMRGLCPLSHVLLESITYNLG